MEIVPFEGKHLHEMRLQQAQEMFYAKFSPHYARALEDAGNGWTALVDGRPVCCAGLVEQWEGRALAWCLMAEDSGAYFVRLVRAIRRALDMAHWRRVEANVDAEFVQGIRLANMLGFEVESKMQKFTPEGRDAFMYVRIKP